MWAGVLGVGIRALRVRSSRLAEERREVVFWGEDEEEDWSWDRMLESLEVDIAIG